MNNELKEILEKCNKATSPNDVEKAQRTEKRILQTILSEE